MLAVCTMAGACLSLGFVGSLLFHLAILLFSCGRFAARETQAPDLTTCFSPWEKAKQKEHGNGKILKTQRLHRVPFVISFSNEICSCTFHRTGATETVSAGRGDLTEGAGEELLVRLQVSADRLQLLQRVRTCK